MKVQYVIERVEYIRTIKADDESAHGSEDALHQEVLQAIADGTCENPKECAKAALETCEIDFARWCA